MLGYPPEAYEGKSGFGVHPEDLPYVAEKFGRWVTVEAKATPVYGENGELEYVIVVARDITERKKTEEYFLKSENLAVAGELAAGIAHEIRNPMASIKGFVQLMKSKQFKLQYFDVRLMNS